MKSVSHDAKGFVEGVINHIKKSGKSRDVSSKVTTLLRKMTASAKAEHQARVEAAVKLTQGQTQSIARILSGIAGHEISLTSTVNPDLIGGIRITMADWVMESSLRSELNDMASIVNVS